MLEMQGLNSRGSVDQIMKEVKKQGGLNAEIQSRIGHQLRAMYDDVVRQGVPDRFAELIKKLDGPEAAAQAAGQTDQTAKNDGRD
jgi:dihydroxyacid dehydratase/phosphogluconate dehydratase